MLQILTVLEAFRGSILRVLPVLAVRKADAASARVISAVSTAHTPSTRSISDDSTAILPVLAVRKVLATVLILRVHCVWCLPCNGDAVGMYMTCIFIWDKTQATRCCFYSDATADMWSCCCAVDAAETYHISADNICLLYTSPSPRDATLSRMPSSA